MFELLPLRKPTTAMTMPSTTTPLKKCSTSTYFWLTEKLFENSHVRASSYRTKQHFRQDSMLLKYPLVDQPVWRPAENTDQNWVEIWLNRAEAIYGIIVAGDPKDDAHVTSFEIMYSEDGHVFSYIIKSNTILF